MTKRGDDRWSSHLGIGIALGLAIGAGFGIALDNLSLGIGPGIALGIAIALAMSNRRPGTADRSTKNALGGRDSDDGEEA
ncbi:MAG: hypothetical protein CME82_14620 [Halomonas sp.]|nr:hypothetical protein [Halomonas sp.]